MEELDRVGVVAGAQGIALIIPRDKEEGRGQGVGFGGSEGPEQKGWGSSCVDEGVECGTSRFDVQQQ